MLTCVRFDDPFDLCDYVRRRNISKDDVQNIVYNENQRLYMLFYWS